MDNKQDFTQGSIFGKMLHFMLPILAALILQAMYGAVDLLIVGKFGTTAGISGVSTGSNIMNLYGMAFGSVVGVFIGAIAFLKGDLLACIFTSDPLVIARAFEYLRGFAFAAPAATLFGIVLCTIYYKKLQKEL